MFWENVLQYSSFKLFKSNIECIPHSIQQVVDDMGNVKFCVDPGSDAASGSWLKYVRTAPSFDEQNLAVCHLSGDQVSGVPLLQSAVRSHCVGRARGQIRQGAHGIVRET